MRSPGGYAVWTEADGQVKETDSFTCGHCQRVTFVPARTDPANLGGLCKVCMRLICARCTAAGVCTPFEKALEQSEARDRFLRSAGLLTLLLLLTSPALAQPPATVIRDGDTETILVEVNGVKLGHRINVKTGEKWELKHERNPFTLGLTKRLHAHKVGELPNEKDPLPGGGAVVEAAPRDAAPADAAPVVIDVNFLYSSACSAANGGNANMPARAALACAQATQTARNSGSPNVTFQCLGPFWVSYTEAAGGNPLNWMYSSTEVKAKRDVTGADLSHLCSTDNACGQGYQCSNPFDRALSQSAASCLTANLSFVHELGHNLCLNHEPAQAGCPNGSGPGTTCPGSNYGHSWGPARDVETYYGGVRVTQFSNPAVLHSGLPTGIAGQRDNHAMFAIKAPVVASFRNRPTVVSPQIGDPPTPRVN